ncbi:MAG TPA: hypothetical protein VL240_12050 [Candidatus Binatia bacterium]|nr:hypothetical protein [Candidatus Binatia bacterium]
MYRRCSGLFLLLSAMGWCQQNPSAPSLTIYNQDFAVVRQTVPLQLKAGVNDVSFDNVTSYLEPSSVILRDPAGKVHLNIVEQNYRTDALSQYKLLRANEGREIDFLQAWNNGTANIVRGKIIRAGTGCFGENPYGTSCYASGDLRFSIDPIVEVKGQVQFGLPGKPLFPSMGDAALLRPALNWQLQSDKSVQLDAEISYITGGLTWEASYNVVAPETGDLLDITGWVSLQNRSGYTFENARLQLMAGDINKIAPTRGGGYGGGAYAKVMAAPVSVPAVTEKAFDEYHLYSLERPSTVENGESKEVEFLRASGVPSRRLYVYEGYTLTPSEYTGSNWQYQSLDANLGLTRNRHVYIMREFRNSEADRLGKPLPAGVMRFYRRDSDGRLQFIGENSIQHTPKDETIRVYTGNAFDNIADRIRTEFRVENQQRWLDESYVIRLRNHKKEPVQVQVVEHMYRRDNWIISANSTDYVKKDSHTVEFTARIPPDGEETVTYSVHYSW